MEREQRQRPPTGPEPSGELLGPYVLLTELSRGELTTVHLAKKQGPHGFQRLVALKRLRPEYAKQQACVELLVDEARLTAGLHHANLVAAHDVGSEGGCYVVSDYVEGENLERVLIRAGTAGHPRFVLPILVDALNGLHAVHNALDEDDEPLHMVHQAPCARHIVVGIDGVGRLTDFSQMRARDIAPSRVRSERLRVAYMAPEQALYPDRVDHRADLFIVGIALWEALTGERLFAAESDERTFQNLLHRRIPRPSEVGMLPPRSFDSLCMRALERDPNARFGSALEMARELRDVALNQALYALPGEIGAWVKSVMGRELVERRRKLGDMSSQEISLAGMPGEHRVDPRKDDPYLNGRIYGGASAVREIATSSPQAPGDAGLFPIQRDEEPTAPRYLAFHSLNEVPRPPRRARVSTPPYGAFSDSVVAKRPERSNESQHSAVVEKPQASEAEVDLEQTTPNRALTPKASSGAAQASSPGSYSHQVAKPQRKRVSKAPARPSAAPEASRAEADAVFEELTTGRHPTVAERTAVPPSSSKPSAVPPSSGKPSAFPPSSGKPASLPQPAHAATLTGRGRSLSPASLPPPLPLRSTPVIETRAAADQRRDSVPTPLGIPAEPVGVPHGAKPPPHAELLPPTLESMRASVTQVEELVLPRALDPGPSSLTPPNTAERTLPPPGPAKQPWRSGMVWGTGALAAVILLAAVVEIRHWARGENHAASVNPAGHLEDTGPTLQGGAEPLPARGVPPAAEPAPSTNVDLQPARAQALSEASAIPTLAPTTEGSGEEPAHDDGRDPSKSTQANGPERAPRRKLTNAGAASARSTPVQDASPDPREQAPSNLARKRKPAPKSPIPDNPY